MVLRRTAFLVAIVMVLNLVSFSVMADTGEQQRLVELQAELDRLSNSISRKLAIENRIAEIGAEIDSISSRLAVIERDKDDIQSRINAIQTALVDLNNRLLAGDNTQNIQARIDSIRSELTQISNRFNSLYSEKQNLIARENQIIADINAIQNEVFWISERVNQGGLSQAEIDSLVSTLNSYVQMLQQLNQELAVISQNKSRIDSEMTALNQRLNQLNAELQQLNQELQNYGYIDIEAIRREIASYQNEINSLTTRSNALVSEKAECERRLRELQSELTGLQSDLREIQNAENRIREISNEIDSISEGDYGDRKETEEESEDNMCRYVPEEPEVNMCMFPRQIILAEGLKSFAVIDGDDIWQEEFPVEPINYFGSTFVPLRKVVETLGGTVDWVGYPIVNLNGKTIDLEYFVKSGDIMYRSSHAFINNACLWDIGLEYEDVPDPESKMESFMADIHDLSTATTGFTFASIAGIFEGLSGAVNSISIKVIGTDTITFKRYGEIMNSAPETVQKLVDMIEAFLVDVSPEGNIEIGDIAVNAAFVMLPFDELADSMKIARKGDNFVVNYGDDVAGIIDGKTAKKLIDNGVDDAFRISTKQLRDNFHRFFPDIAVLEGQQMHHLFPVKYRKYFMRMGIDIDDGRHLVPVDQGLHSRISSGWNDKWDEFLDRYNRQVGLEQRTKAFKEAEKLASDANIPIYWRRYYDSKFLP